MYGKKYNFNVSTKMYWKIFSSGVLDIQAIDSDTKPWNFSHTFCTKNHLGVRNGAGFQNALLFWQHFWKLRARRGKRICDTDGHRRDASVSRARAPHRVLHFAQCCQKKRVLMAFDVAIVFGAHSSSCRNLED